MASVKLPSEQILALTSECEAKINASTRLQGTFCRGVFDGWKCWLDTPAGSTARTNCPPFVPGFDPLRFAHRVCESNGSWFRHHNPPYREWSNYTDCVNGLDMEFRNSVNNVYVVGYFVSLVALLISIVIFLYFRSLHCARITLHMNLFTSFAINNVLWIVWYKVVVPGVYIIDENPLWCRVLHIIIQYVLLSNYSLMLCEGLYLHTVLVRAFAAERRLLVMLLLGGWLSPALVIAAYVVVRTNIGDELNTANCWTYDESPAMTMLSIIAGCLLVLNSVLLCNIVRVLCTKLRAAPRAASRPSATAVQALRATFMLIPLLGLHYLVLSFRPQGPAWEQLFEYVSAVTISFQGLCVATLFCFCNGEVASQVRRKWRAVTFRPRANSCTNTTVSFIRSTAQPLSATSEEKV